jgi:hypothetical protein
MLRQTLRIELRGLGNGSALASMMANADSEESTRASS